MQSPVNITSLVDLYEYHSGVLIASYSVLFFVASVANILGWIAFYDNEFRADRSFLFTASSMQHTYIVDEGDYARRGSIPVPTGALEKRLLFKKMEDGWGWGFVVLVEERGGGEEGQEEGKRRGKRRGKRTRKGTRRGRIEESGPSKQGVHDIVPGSSEPST